MKQLWLICGILSELVVSALVISGWFFLIFGCFFHISHSLFLGSLFLVLAYTIVKPMRKFFKGKINRFR